MGLFDQFPYTNFHELNLDWILKALKELEHTIEQFVAINALKYADPIQWNIVSQYEKNTIVIDPQTGTAYISVQPVPSGVALTNEDYWTVVFDLGRFVVRASKNFANTYEAETTLTATVSTAAGGWIVWGDTLYKALVNITAGDSYVVGGNIAHFTIEDVIGHLEDLTTTEKSNLVAAINEVAAEVLGKIGDLADLNTQDKSNLVAAINEALTDISNEATARADADNALTESISNEATARADAVNALTENINNRTAISIKDFGAVGDGTTDDTTAIQAAINAANGKALFIPSGEYVVDSLTIPNGYAIDIFGAGMTTSIFIAKQSGSYIFDYDDGFNEANISFRNIGFKGNNLANTRAFNIQRLRSATFVNIMFERLTYGFYIDRCFNVIINNIYVQGAVSSKFYSSDHSDAVGNFITDFTLSNYQHDVAILGSESFSDYFLTFDNMINSSASNITTRGLAGIADGIHITGRCEGFFLSNCVMVWARYAFNIEPDTASIPFAVNLTNCSADMCTGWGFNISTQHSVFDKCYAFNSADPAIGPATYSGIILRADCKALTFINCESARNYHSGYAIPNGIKDIKFINCTAHDNNISNTGDTDFYCADTAYQVECISCDMKTYITAINNFDGHNTDKTLYQSVGTANTTGAQFTANIPAGFINTKEHLYASIRGNANPNDTITINIGSGSLTVTVPDGLQHIYDFNIYNTGTTAAIEASIDGAPAGDTLIPSFDFNSDTAISLTTSAAFISIYRICKVVRN